MTDGAVSSHSSGAPSKAQMDLKEFERYLTDATATIKKEKAEFAKITRELDELEAERTGSINPQLDRALAAARARYANSEDDENDYEEDEGDFESGRRRREGGSGMRRRKRAVRRRLSPQQQEELGDSSVAFVGYRGGGRPSGPGYSSFGAPNIDLEYIGCDGSNAWFGPYFGTPPAASSTNNWYFYEGAWFYLCPM